MITPLQVDPGQFHRPLSSLLVAALVLTATPQARTGEPPAEGVDPVRIKALWKRQKGEISSGKFEVILFRYFDGSARRLDRAEAVKRLEALKPGAGETAIEPIFNDLVALGWPKQKSFLWGTKIDVTIDGPKIANVTHKAEGNDIRGFDGHVEVAYRAANKQATISAGRSGIHLVGLREIRTIPDGEIDWENKPTIDPADGRGTVLRSSGLTVSIDPDNGFLRRLTRSHDGVISEEILQLDPTIVQGMVLPRITVDLKLENDKVRMASIYLIKSSHPNIPIAAPDFWLGVPTGTLVVDHLRNPASPTAVRTVMDLDDVRSYQNAIER